MYVIVFVHKIQEACIYYTGEGLKLLLGIVTIRDAYLFFILLSTDELVESITIPDLISIMSFNAALTVFT